MYRDHRDLHVLTHSFPTRRSSELEALLDRSIGQVVSAANAGALDQRIDTAALDGVAAKIGQQINTLLDTMGEAINSIQTTVAGLAAGDLRLRMEGRYEGLFAKLQANRNDMAGKLAAVRQKL